MSKGFWAADSIAQSIERVGDAARHNASLDREIAYIKKSQAEYQKLVNEFEEMARSNAANLAEKNALRAALTKFDAKHPLLTNNHLRERIKTAGERVLAVSNNWDDVARAGYDFKY